MVAEPSVNACILFYEEHPSRNLALAAHFLSLSVVNMPQLCFLLTIRLAGGDESSSTPGYALERLILQVLLCLATPLVREASVAWDVFERQHPEVSGTCWKRLLKLKPILETDRDNPLNQIVRKL
jgi:hypothetical protein